MALERFDIHLPDHTEMVWVSEAAKYQWEKILRDASAAWNRVELELVAEGLRPAMLRNVRPENIMSAAAMAASEGLAFLPLEQVGTTKFYASSTPPINGNDWEYRVYVGNSDLAEDFLKAYERRDDKTIGKFLGYPECCREFFADTWGKGMRDTTIPQAAVHLVQPLTWLPEEPIEISTSVECSMLLRWAGIRLVSHLPCSFTCRATVKMAHQNLEIFKSLGLGDSADKIVQLLSMPIDYSTAHGITIIKTPIFKIITTGEGISGTVQIFARGTYLPPESARGVGFPYNRSLITKGDILKPSMDKLWKDNGFNDLKSMDSAHEMVLAACVGIGVCDGPWTVIDLGCGNGLLLKKIKNLNPKIITAGVEVNAGVTAVEGVDIQYSNLFDLNLEVAGRWNIAIISRNRFKEPGGDSLGLILGELAEIVVMYSYDGDGSLPPIQGFEMTNEIKDEHAIIHVFRKE